VSSDYTPIQNSEGVRSSFLFITCGRHLKLAGCLRPETWNQQDSLGSLGMTICNTTLSMRLDVALVYRDTFEVRCQAACRLFTRSVEDILNNFGPSFHRVRQHPGAAPEARVP
jgi:hypothetical protein